MNIHDMTEQAYKNGYEAGAKESEAKNKELDEKLLIYRGIIDWQAKEINRQKAEIENLKHNLECVKQHKEKLIERSKLQRSEIERLRTMHSEMCIGMKRLKWETRKRFAKFLINKAKNGIIYADDIPDYSVEFEEMESERDAEE